MSPRSEAILALVLILLGLAMTPISALWGM